MQNFRHTYDLLTGSASISGRLSLSEHPWLADYKLFDRVILARTGIVELALSAGLAVGSPRVLELTLAVPLSVPDRGGLQVQVQVEAADAQGHRVFSLHSRGEASSVRSGGWTRHALGVLAGPELAMPEAAALPFLEEWPPAAATPLNVSDLYARLSARGLDYGPAFQGVTGIWRLGEAIYAQVALPAGTASGVGEYGIHPALFGVALFVLAAAEEFVDDDEGSVLLPCGWSDVTLHARGASELRVRLELCTSGEGPERASGSMVLCDGTGQPVARVGCLTLRRATREQVRAAVQSKHEELYRDSPGIRRGAAGSTATSTLRLRLSKLPKEERLGTLVALVQEVVTEVRGVADMAAISAAQALMGIDSLMAVEVSRRLSARAETTLPITLVFDYPTPEAIAELLLRQLFAELDATVRSAATPWRVRDEPIAIVAMSCRTPGGGEDLEGYWALLVEGQDAIGPFPARWDRDALYDPSPQARGKSYVREGGFLRNVDQFDADFFGIAPREAVSMDPQQRLMLEVVWEVLERAGIRPQALNESSTGVYLGSMGSDYGQGSLESLDGYVETGQASSVLSGRVSYALGLQGPAMTVDTACSSSLTAVHLACQGLRQGECDLALAGGVQVMSTPARFVEFSRLSGLARDGRCKAFSAGADGAGWSEGCGVLVLKRVSDAERDGDEILAVIRGSAVNHDGRSQGLTAPNGPSQQRVIRAALSAAGVDADAVDAVEAHGTGTSLGDPIEAGALAAVFGGSRSAERPLWLGSSKSNIGHTASGGGCAGRDQDGAVAAA